MKTFFSLSLILVLFSFAVQAGDRPSISQAQMQSLQSAAIAPEYTLLDVRSDEEFQAGHVPGAINISHKILSDQLSALPADKDQLVIVYCRSGRRAGIAEQILRDNGFTQVRHLSGDMNGWQESDLPIAK